MESDYIWDPLRKKSVRNTPEEAVRQWFIGVLHQGMGVPEHMMGSEVAFSHAGKDYRADVIVYDRTAKPLMVVECKRPEVTLDQNVVDQALRYNNELNVRYIVITNGLKTFIFQRQPDGWQFMQKAPMWGEMADGKGQADGKMADGKGQADEKRQADGKMADGKEQADSDEMPGEAGHDGEVCNDGEVGRGGEASHDEKVGYDGGVSNNGEAGHDGEVCNDGKVGRGGEASHDGKVGHDGEVNNAGEVGHDGKDEMR